ncbi:hypothetical protein HZC33_01140 [Candidatus Wolfebacteria bacterium]|nr:hypothetical protein [Candidatus Wolfebacteria bacterium]
MDKKRIKVYWADAVFYKKSKNIGDGLTKMITIGELFIENEKFIVIKYPKSIKENKPLLFQLFKRFLSKKPTYLFIPRGMIRNIILY